MMGRPIAGRLRGIEAEPGTILGPHAVTREFLVALSTDDGVTTLGYATTHEIDAATEHEFPRSVTEARLRQASRSRLATARAER